MKLACLLAVCLVVAAASPTVTIVDNTLKVDVEPGTPLTQNERSILINLLIRQLFELIRRIITNGSSVFNIPPLDPLIIDHTKLNVPAGLINFEIEITKGVAAGIGDFVVHRSHFDLRELSFDIDISVPSVQIKAEQYRLVGDLYNAIPFFGEGEANLIVQNFRFRAKLFLKQSDDQKSILIDRIENPAFGIDSLKSDFSGIIGGGDIDTVANQIIEEVILSYINRLNRPIALVSSEILVRILNPFLNQLDSWRFIDMLL